MRIASDTVSTAPRRAIRTVFGLSSCLAANAHAAWPHSVVLLPERFRVKLRLRRQTDLRSPTGWLALYPVVAVQSICCAAQGGGERSGLVLNSPFA